MREPAATTLPRSVADPLDLVGRADGAGQRGVGSVQNAALHMVSVIVPTLNEEKLVEQSMAQLVALCRRGTELGVAMELIVSDGGSRDRTVELAQAYADSVVEHTESRRQTIAEGRNCGAARARGNLLVFINADTVPRNPEQFVQALAELHRVVGGGRMRAAAVACPVEVAPEERGWSDRLFHGFFNRYVRLLNAVGMGMGRGECQIVRRDAFLQVGGYNGAMAAGEDFDLYTRLVRLGPIAHEPAFTVYESPRRFRRYGYLRVLAQWTMNALGVLVLRRSISREWEEIR